MDILIVSQYLRDIEDFSENNSRFIYLVNLLAQNIENTVEIITSDFNHATKKHFRKCGELHSVRFTVLHEPGYSKNVSLKRFVSHKKLAKNVGQYLRNRQKPDVCYCAVPSLDVAGAVAQYCKGAGIRFIVDIQDLWPEAFKMVFHIPILSDLIFFPMKKKADKIYALADEVVAVSDTYAKRAMRVNKKCKAATVAYLGTEKANFDRYAKIAVEKYAGITIAYVGSMSASYDLKSVIDAMSKIKSSSIKLLAMGDGALRTAFTEYAKEKGVNAEFTGKLIYPQMVERLLQCDIAVNPIRKDSAGSILNKVGDYAMAGLPVINTQECLEYQNLLNQYQAGINCDSENIIDIKNAIECLMHDSDLRVLMGRNSRRMAEELFDREKTYVNIKNLILSGEA